MTFEAAVLLLKPEAVITARDLERMGWTRRTYRNVGLWRLIEWWDPPAENGREPVSKEIVVIGDNDTAQRIADALSEYQEAVRIAEATRVEYSAISSQLADAHAKAYDSGQQVDVAVDRLKRARQRYERLLVGLADPIDGSVAV